MRQWADIRFEVGSAQVLEEMVKLPALPIFSEEAAAFLSDLSHRLLTTPEVKAYSDVMTFAFWCRKASVNQMARGYADEMDRFGRGIVFHIAPSNVALNFAYSMAAALLAGNACIVRLPSKSFPQVDMVCAAMREALEDNDLIQRYYVLVRYGHNKSINDALSALCDTRVIWGGDQTIESLRQSPLSPRANEIAFADRYSIAIIGAKEYLQAENKEQIARDFFNDTYLTDQNACTAPRLIVWLGSREIVAQAQEQFWETMQRLVEKQYDLQPVQAVDKLTAQYLMAAEVDIHAVKGEDNRIVRIEADRLDDNTLKYRANSGFFIEYSTVNLADILPVCDSRCQTVSYFGVEKELLVRFICEARPRGLDRIVPIGHSMDFSLVWDGIDLIRSMSRIIEVR